MSETMGYAPSEEEVKIAEESMTPEQVKMSERRSRDYWFKDYEHGRPVDVQKKVEGLTKRQDEKWNLEGYETGIEEVGSNQCEKQIERLAAAEKTGEKVFEVEFNVPIKVKLPVADLMADTSDAISNAAYYATGFVGEVAAAKIKLEIANNHSEELEKVKRYEALNCRLWSMFDWSNKRQCEMRTPSYDYDEAQEIMDEMDAIHLELVGTEGNWHNGLANKKIESLKNQFSATNVEFRTHLKHDDQEAR